MTWNILKYFCPFKNRVFNDEDNENRNNKRTIKHTSNKLTNQSQSVWNKESSKVLALNSSPSSPHDIEQKTLKNILENNIQQQNSKFDIKQPEITKFETSAETLIIQFNKEIVPLYNYLKNQIDNSCYVEGSTTNVERILGRCKDECHLDTVKIQYTLNDLEKIFFNETSTTQSIVLCNVLYLFYPIISDIYDINMRKIILVKILDIFENYGIHISQASTYSHLYLLDPILKCFIFINMGLSGVDFNVNKLNIVCERNDNIFEDLLKNESIKKIFFSNTEKTQVYDSMQHYIVYPFFYSVYGTKVVNGINVEEGEGRGPQKEFFDKISASITRDRGIKNNILYYIKDSESYWINENLEKSENNKTRLCLFGIIIALSIESRIPLGISINPYLCKQILGDYGQPSLEDVKIVDNGYFKSLEKIFNMSLVEFENILKLEDLPIQTTRDKYVEQSIHSRLYSEIKWQLDEIKKGFEKVILLKYARSFKLTPNDLRVAILGYLEDPLKQRNFKFTDVFRIIFDDGLASDEEFKKIFCDVIDSFESKDKRKLLKFITAVDKLPISGTEIIRIELMTKSCRTKEEANIILQTLPQAHTCDNVLEIPEYYKANLLLSENIESKDQLRYSTMEILKVKLLYACDNADGYGLDIIADSYMVEPSLRKQMQENVLLEEHANIHNKIFNASKGKPALNDEMRTRDTVECLVDDIPTLDSENIA